MKLTIALSNLKKELLLGSFFAFTIKAGGVASAFALNIVIARNLGAEQAGYFFLAQTILLILAPFSRQGLDNCLIRFIAGYKDKDTNENNVAGIYRLALQRVTPVALSLSASLWFASEWLAIYVFSKPQLGSALKLCSLAITPLALAQLHAYCFQGKKRIVLSMLFESSALATLAFALICLIQPNNAPDTMRCYLLATLLVFGCALYIWNKGRNPKLFSLAPREREHVLSTARPMFVTFALFQFIQWSSQLLLGIWEHASDIALFATAHRTAMLVSFILIAINSIAAPKFAEAYKLGELDEVRKIALHSSRIMTLTAFPVLVAMLLLAPALMRLFGKEFEDGAILLRILVLGQFVNILTGSVAYLLQMTGHEKLLRNNATIATIFMVTGSLVFIPLFGVYGAAAVTALTVAGQNILCVYQVKRVLGFNTLSIFQKI